MITMEIAKFVIKFATKYFPIRLTLALPNLTVFTVITLDKKIIGVAGQWENALIAVYRLG